MEKMMEKPAPRAAQQAPVQRQPNRTGIPQALKNRVERSSGFSLDDVRVQYQSVKPAQLRALAYTQGNRVYIGPGQERHLPHELGHVVQQKAGLVRPTGLMNGLPINDDPALERHASAVASLPVAQLRAAAHPAPVVQRAPTTDEEKEKFFRFYEDFFNDPDKAHEKYAAKMKKKPKSAPKLSDLQKLIGHIYEGKNAETGKDSETPTGLHAYSDPKQKGRAPVCADALGVLPEGVELVGTLGDINRVHIIIWKKGDKESYSTMMPRNLRERQTRALFMAAKYSGTKGLRDNYSGIGIPSPSAMISDLLGADAELKKRGDTIYPSLPGYDGLFLKNDQEILEAIKTHNDYVPAR